MERWDAIVAGIGVLVVVTAIAGVVLTGPGSGPSYTVVFSEQRQALPAQQGAFQGEGQRDVSVQVDTLNLTRLEFTVRVTGAGPRVAPDTLTVQVTGPDGRSESQQASLAVGAAGDATLTFTRDLGTPPQAVTVRAPTPEAAVAAIPGDQATRAGLGTWTVSVSARTSGVGPLHTEGHTILVETTAVAYQAAIQPEVANPR